MEENKLKYSKGKQGHDFEMPMMLSDNTEVRISKWKNMKSYAMKDSKKPNFEKVHWMKEFTAKERSLLKALIEAQGLTGDDKGPLEPTPNPFYEGDGEQKDDAMEFDPFDDQVEEDEAEIIDPST